MEKKEVATHYSLPEASDLEKSIAKEYKIGFASIPSYLEGFGSFLFPMRIPSEDLKDSHESRGATDLYDEALLEVYGLALAKAEIAASEATEENAGSVLDNILSEKDDFFLGELQKKDNWKKYLTMDCITGWYDDKRRAVMRGLANKGITLQEKVDKADTPAAPKPRRFRLLYGVTIANTVLLAALASYAVVGSIFGVSMFRKETQSIKQEMEMKEKAYIYQFYEFADRIDPPENEKDKIKKHNLPLAERIEKVIQVYENRIIAKGEARYQAISAGQREQWKRDIIAMIKEGKFDGAIEGYLKRKMGGD